MNSLRFLFWARRMNKWLTTPQLIWSHFQFLYPSIWERINNYNINQFTSLFEFDSYNQFTILFFQPHPPLMVVLSFQLVLHVLPTLFVMLKEGHKQKGFFFLMSGLKNPFQLPVRGGLCPGSSSDWIGFWPFA